MFSEQGLNSFNDGLDRFRVRLHQVCLFVFDVCDPNNALQKLKSIDIMWWLRMHFEVIFVHVGLRSDKLSVTNALSEGFIAQACLLD